MPTQVLTQLRALRESIADALRKDPRYLTLTALDKTITEIDGVLKQSGLATGALQAPEPLQFAENPPANAPSLQTSIQHSYGTEAHKPHQSATTAEPAGQSAQSGTSVMEAPSTRESEHAADEPKEDELATPLASSEAQPAPGNVAQHAPGPTDLEASSPAHIATIEPELNHAADEDIDAPAAAPHFEPALSPTEPAFALPEEVVAQPIEAASHEAESHEAESLEAARHELTSHDLPSHELPSHELPSHELPSHELPSHELPSHELPSHELAAQAEEEITAPTDTHEDHVAQMQPALDPSLMNYQVIDEDESVALALGATGADAAGSEAETLESEDAQDAAFAEAEHAHQSSGYVPMQAKIGSAIYQPAMSVKFGKLPNKVDLRPLMQPCEDRVASGSAVAQAVAGAYEYWIRKASKLDRPVSRMFLYYNARWRAAAAERDDGCTIQFALESLMRFGACAESAWPEEQELLFARPGGEAYRDASSSKIHDMAHVPLRIDAWKQALAEGKPIVFGCATFEGFDDCAERGGVVAMPSPEVVAKGISRLRPLCAVGYSEHERVFIVRSSEGAAFGDQGYCYMPFDYLMSEVLNDGDCWVFIPKVPSQPPREVWSDDTTPVTNGGAGVSFPIEAHQPADYVAVGRDLFAGERQPYPGDMPEDYAHYVALAGRGAWDEMEPNDAGMLLAAATLEGGMAALASAFPGSSGARAVGARRDEAFGHDRDRDDLIGGGRNA